MTVVAAYFAAAMLMLCGTGFAAVKADQAAKAKRHAACIANTARLERELGIGIPFDERFASAIPSLVVEGQTRVLPMIDCGDIEAQIKAEREWGKRFARYNAGRPKGL